MSINATGQSLPFWDSLRQDMVAHIDSSQRNQAFWFSLSRRLSIIIRSSGFHVAFLYRVAHLMRSRLGTVGKVTAGILFWMVRHAYGVSIASTARIEGGLILPHPQGIVVGANVVIGPRAWIFQNVTIGGSPSRVGMPRIGADARIYPGVVVGGPVTIGDRVLIGANAVVTRDLPSGAVAKVAPLTLTLSPNHAPPEAT